MAKTADHDRRRRTSARPEHETFEQMRKRLLVETERFLLFALENPGKVVRIPIRPITDGGFPRRFADAFWEQAVGIARQRHDTDTSDHARVG